MNQSINTVLHLDKRAEVGQVPNPSCDYGTNGVTFRQRRPWIRLRLFETKRYAAIVHVHVKHEGFDILADLKQLRRMLHALAPGHLRHMNESLDSGFQLDERPVVGQVNHSPSNTGANGINLPHQRPRIRSELFEPQGHSFLFAVVLQNLDCDLFTNVEYFRRVVHAAPGEIGDMQ